MAAKLSTLPAETQQALTVLACAGSGVGTELLAVLLQCSEGEVHCALVSAVREGLLTRSGDAYEFRHDRIQQAAYESVVDEAARCALHG